MNRMKDISGKWYKPLLFTLLIFLCLLPGYLFSSLKVSDGFLYQIIAYVKLTLDSNHLSQVSSGGYSFGFVDFLPGYPMIISIISRVSNLLPEQVHYLPIAGLLLPASLFVLGRKLFDSIVLASLLALYGALDIGLSIHYNVFAYTWSNFLYLSFIIVYLEFMEHRQPRFIIILFLLFAGSLFIHYGATMWLIVFVLSMGAINLIIKKRRKNHGAVDVPLTSFAMPLAFIVAFLVFNQIIYKVWLPSFQDLMMGSKDPIGLFSAKIGSYMGFATQPHEPYRYLNPWGPAFGWWRAAEYLLIFAPIVIWIVSVIVASIFRRQRITIKYPLISLAIVIVITAISDWFVYGIHSGFTMRYVSLAFPILTIIALFELKAPRWLQQIIVASIVLTAAMTFFIGWQFYLTLDQSTYDEIASSSDWIASQQIDGIVLSDLDTFGLYLVSSSSNSEDYPSLMHYDSEQYESLINPGAHSNSVARYDYVMIDAKGIGKPIHGISNRIYEPLAFHMEEIEMNSFLSKFYDDGNIWLMVRGREIDE